MTKFKNFESKPSFGEKVKIFMILQRQEVAEISSYSTGSLFIKDKKECEILICGQLRF